MENLIENIMDDEIVVTLQDRYERLCGVIGPDMAFYCICAAFDVPYSPKITAKSWDEYIRKLRRKEHDGFSAGETDARVCLKKGANERERWEAEWGLGDKENRYTVEDYKRLDEILKTLSARNVGGMDAQQEYTLRNCAQMALLREKCVWKGDKESIDKAKSLDKMIQENLASENLRKKDASSAQTARLDGIVDVLRKKCGVGVELTKDQVVEICSKWLISHHYNCTKDAAEHAMLSIINAMKINSDQPTMEALPVEAQLTDYAREFESEMSAVARRERNVYEYLGIRRGVITNPKRPVENPKKKPQEPDEGGITDG